LTHCNGVRQLAAIWRTGNHIEQDEVGPGVLAITSITGDAVVTQPPEITGMDMSVAKLGDISDAEIIQSFICSPMKFQKFV
jgi:hypothetical protein